MPPSPHNDEVIFQVAVALTCGAILVTPSHSVGPYRLGLSSDARYVCLNRVGAELVGQELEEHWVSWFHRQETINKDFSAFGAAKTFVDNVGKRRALLALRSIEKTSAQDGELTLRNAPIGGRFGSIDGFPEGRRVCPSPPAEAPEQGTLRGHALGGA